MNYAFRLADISDSEEILNIYAPYIRDTYISFETEVPSVSEFARRIETICRQYPFIVCLVEDKIIGYAYASKHRERAAYCYSVDVSIYVLPEYHGSGTAYKLYEYLFYILKELGYYSAYAAVVVPNDRSICFHQKFGFSVIGTFQKAGYKFGKWLDVIWLEKAIKSYDKAPGAVKSMNELSVDCFNWENCDEF